MSGTGLLDSLTVTGQLTGFAEAISPPPPISWPLEIHFAAYSLAEMTLWGLLITRESGEVFPLLLLMELYLK